VKWKVIQRTWLSSPQLGIVFYVIHPAEDEPGHQISTECSHETSGMQHIDNFCNDQQFVRRNVQPGIECLDKLAAYFFAWIRGNESERLKDDLYVVQPQMIDGMLLKMHLFILSRPSFFCR